MKFLLISLSTALLCLGSAYGQEKKIQKFNPVYGSQNEINELLSFVSTNIKVELSEDQIRGVNGYMVCKFRLDTLGNIHTIRVGHSLRPWIDYAIVGAMNRLPPYGTPATDRRGEKKDVERQLVFSFGTSLKPLDHIGFNEEKVRQNTQDKIDAQLAEINRKKMEDYTKWGNFTKENATLKYDSRDALKGSYPTLPQGMDPLKTPIITPRISVAGVDDKLTRPAIQSAEGK